MVPNLAKIWLEGVIDPLEPFQETAQQIFLFLHKVRGLKLLTSPIPS